MLSRVPGPRPLDGGTPERPWSGPRSGVVSLRANAPHSEPSTDGSRVLIPTIVADALAELTNRPRCNSPNLLKTRREIKFSSLNSVKV